MKKFCNYCNENIEVKNFQSFGAHRRNCKCNPNIEEFNKRVGIGVHNSAQPKIELIRNCPKCGIEYSQITVQSSINIDRIKKFCSRKCANAHVHTKESKQKISKSNLDRCITNTNNKSCKVKFLNCIYCNNLFTHHGNRKLYCNKKECHSKHLSLACTGKTGGIREGGGYGKRGKIEDYYFQSTWEAAFIRYHLDHKISFVRNTEGFEYKLLDGSTRKFYPDFIYEDGTYVEVKGRRNFDSLDELNQAKLNGFKLPLILLQKDEMENMLYYCRKFYGKDFYKCGVGRVA